MEVFQMKYSLKKVAVTPPVLWVRRNWWKIMLVPAVANIVIALLNPRHVDHETRHFLLLLGTMSLLGFLMLGASLTVRGDALVRHVIKCSLAFGLTSFVLGSFACKWACRNWQFSLGCLTVLAVAAVPSRLVPEGGSDSLFILGAVGLLVGVAPNVLGHRRFI
jgi:hypothetical protein